MTVQRWPNENRYDAAVAAAASMYNVPAALIKALIAQESEFAPTAYRDEPQLPPYNAPGLEKGGDASRGLMQLLYRTAWGEGFRGSAQSLYDPATNIQWGTKFFGDLLHYAQARGYGIPSAVSAYNAGGSADRAGDGKRSTKRKDGKTADGAAWAPFINQPYVDKVLSYYAYFEQQQQQQQPQQAGGGSSGSPAPVRLPPVVTEASLVPDWMLGMFPGVSPEMLALAALAALAFLLLTR